MGITSGLLMVAVGLTLVVLLPEPSWGRLPLHGYFNVLLGLVFVLQGAAELLPVSRKKLAGWLRSGAVAAGLLGLSIGILGILGVP